VQHAWCGTGAAVAWAQTAPIVVSPAIHSWRRKLRAVGVRELRGAQSAKRSRPRRLSGSFSDSDQLLTAREVNSYLLTSGEAVTYTWDWQATRTN
jgi:hypothetical protein